MQKDFDAWNFEKKKVNKSQLVQYFHEREVWMVSMGVNIGFEQDGKGLLFQRPVCIIKKLNKHFFIGIPLTRKMKNNIHTIPVFEARQDSYLIFSQIRAFDARRLAYRIETVPHKRFGFIKQKIREYL